MSTPDAADRPLRIRWINPIGVPDYDEPIAELIAGIKEPTTEVEVVSFAMEGSPPDLEYLAYEGLVTADIVRVVRDAATHAYDGVVIGCFYDVALDSARNISGRSVVVAPCEASLQTAINLCSRFSIIVGRELWVDQMRRNVIDYGYGEALASFQAVGLSVTEFQKDPPLTKKLMMEAGRRAIRDDKAECLILGCTIEYGFYADMQKELGVPVIDCTLASFKACEQAAGLARQFGWVPSRMWGCAAPPEKQLAEYGVFARPAPIGNRIVIPAT